MSPLSSDRLNGHPAEHDPNPSKRARVTRVRNGIPAHRRAQRELPEDHTRRVNVAAANKARAIKRQRTEKLLEIYGAEAPVSLPGEKQLFSRWMQDKGAKRTRFKDLEEFCAYLVKNFGTPEKDAEWRAFMEQAEPEEELQERLARETFEAIEAAETNRPSVPVLATKDLPPSFVTSPDVAADQLTSMGEAP